MPNCLLHEGSLPIHLADGRAGRLVMLVDFLQKHLQSDRERRRGGQLVGGHHEAISCKAVFAASQQCAAKSNWTALRNALAMTKAPGMFGCTRSQAQ